MWSLPSRLPPQEDEEYFACKWSYNQQNNAALLLLAGKNNIMRVLDVSRGTLLWVMATSTWLVCLAAQLDETPQCSCRSDLVGQVQHTTHCLVR